MGFSKPKIPEPIQPASRPERIQEVEPEDVQMGDTDSQETTKKQGKRSLMRPSGATGLSV